MAASMDTLLERASALSQRNTSRAGDLFKKLTQDVARLTEENAQLQVQVTKLTELCERREQDLAATRSELRVKTQLAVREREQAERVLADAKKEAEVAHNTLRVLRADPVLDARVANASRIAADPAAVARAEREGADARTRQAAAAAAAAPSFSVHGAAKDVIAQIAGSGAGGAAAQQSATSGFGAAGGAAAFALPSAASMAPIAPGAGSASFGPVEVGDSAAASAAIERVRAILMADPAVAAVLDERRVREAALEAAGIGAAAAAKQAREAVEESSAAAAAVDRVRIASLEKKLATAREAAEAARADLELERKAVTQLTAERVDRAALEATVERLRGQLLSLLQQQEAINMYFALMDGTPDAGAGITLVGLEEPHHSAAGHGHGHGSSSAGGAGGAVGAVGGTAAQRAAAKAAYDALDGSSSPSGSGSSSAVGAGNMASYVAAMREAQQRAAQSVMAEVAAADAAVAAQNEVVAGAVVARGQEAKRRAQAMLESRKPTTTGAGAGAGVGPSGGASADGSDGDDGSHDGESDPVLAAEEAAAAAARRRAELADAGRAPDDQDRALAAFQAPLMGLRSVGGSLIPSAAVDAVLSLLADSDGEEDERARRAKKAAAAAARKAAAAPVDSIAAAASATRATLSSDIDGIDRDEDEVAAQAAAEAAVRALAKEDPLQASAEAEKADAEALKRAVAAEGWLAPLADRTRFVPHGSGRPGQPAFVPIAMLSRRIFVLLWRNARKTAQRSFAAAARDAAAEAGGAAVPTGPCTIGSDMTLRLGDLSEGAPEEMQRIPGLWEQLARSARRIAESTAAPTGTGAAGSSSSSAASDAWQWVPLSESNWEWAVAKALPGVHRGVLLLRLAERLRCELGDLVIRLPEYAAPEVLLGNDEADAVQERLFVLLAARVWGVTPAAASAAIRAQITGAAYNPAAAAAKRDPLDEDDESDRAAAARDAAAAASGAAAAASTAAEEGLRGGYITLHDILAKAFPVWSILGAYPEFAPPALRPIARGAAGGNGGGVDLDPAAGGSTRVTLATWHEFFVRRARTASLPELVHLLRALRYLLVAASGKHRRDWWARAPILTPLLLQSMSEEERDAQRIKPKDGSATAATAAPSFGSKVAGAIDGSGECIIM